MGKEVCKGMISVIEVNGREMKAKEGRKEQRGVGIVRVWDVRTRERW